MAQSFSFFIIVHCSTQTRSDSSTRTLYEAYWRLNWLHHLPSHCVLSLIPNTILSYSNFISPHTLLRNQLIRNINSYNWTIELVTVLSRLLKTDIHISPTVDLLHQLISTSWCSDPKQYWFLLKWSRIICFAVSTGTKTHTQMHGHASIQPVAKGVRGLGESSK